MCTFNHSIGEFQIRRQISSIIIRRSGMRFQRFCVQNMNIDRSANRSHVVFSQRNCLSELSMAQRNGKPFIYREPHTFMLHRAFKPYKFIYIQKYHTHNEMKGFDFYLGANSTKFGWIWREKCKEFFLSFQYVRNFSEFCVCIKFESATPTIKNR